MKSRFFKNLFSLMLLGILAGCSGLSNIKVPDTEVCAVSGKISAGGNCVRTLSPETRQLGFDEFLDFLEASEEILNPDGSVLRPAKGAALCQSSDDFNKIKTTLEQACYLLKKRCTFEMQQVIRSMSDTMSYHEAQSKKPSKKKK
ncbi:MAG: hypothetical protein IPN68_18380 [Bacteroidetes bacterium]|nr:hypothetical protein [Bacteroidota bacterium]